MPSGDTTTDLIVNNNEKATAFIVSKEQGILCGIKLAMLVFLNLDSKLKIKTKLKDGNIIRKNQIILSISGNKKSILKAERTALNFLGFATGIATKLIN